MAVELTDIAKKAGERYSSYAEEYVRIYWDDHSDQVYLDKFLRRIRKPGLILDIGCGPGRELRKLICAGYWAVGIDASEKMLQIAIKNNPAAKVYQMDASRLNFPNNYFDGAISLYVLDHLPTPRLLKSFSEIFRVLKNSAPFLLISCDGDFEGERRDFLAPSKTIFRNFKPVDWLVKALKKTGFSIYFSEVRKLPDIGLEDPAEKRSIIIATK
ncbi:MAG: methyltransferase domain-containing protein [Candidatus Pacebacteria bacterium]|nr:methyltransferase domain-containing protein [Candidatus Paceibacterota bacterium]